MHSAQSDTSPGKEKARETNELVLKLPMSTESVHSQPGSAGGALLAVHIAMVHTLDGSAYTGFAHGLGTDPSGSGVLGTREARLDAFATRLTVAGWALPRLCTSYLLR